MTELQGFSPTFLEHADAINAYAPCLRSVSVGNVRDSAAKVLALPFVRRVADLNLETLHPDSVTAFNECPDWGPIERLRVTFEFSSYSEEDPGACTLGALSEAPLVRAARRFEVQYGYFLAEDDDREDGEFPHAQEPSLRELRRLKMPNLRGFGIHGLGADSVAELARWPLFTQLDCLDFGICNMTDAAGAALFRATPFPQLTTLLLNENDFNERTAESLAMCPGLSGLKTLNLVWSSLYDPAADALAASTTLPAALSLDISGNHFTKRAVAKLRARFGPGVVDRGQH